MPPCRTNQTVTSAAKACARCRLLTSKLSSKLVVSAGYCKGNVLSTGGKWPPNNWSGLKVAMNQAQLLNGNKWGDTQEVRVLVSL